MKPARRKAPSARSIADLRLRKPNVWATAFGHRRRDQQIQEEVTYVVYVKRKVAKSKLRSHERVPASVVRAGRRFSTDVVELGPLRFEGSPAIATGGESNALAIHDFVSQSTVTCFAASEGIPFGISCAHGLIGNDRTPAPSPVQAFQRQAGEWVTVGSSDRLLKMSGQGLPTNFGFIDAGLFRIDEPFLLRHASRQPDLSVFRPVRGANLRQLLTQKPVWGVGVRAGLCNGVIEAVEWMDLESGLRTDLVIREAAGNGMTQQGDSGMLWRAPNGAGVGVHCLGERVPQGSPISMAFLLYRMVDIFRLGALKATG